MFLPVLFPISLLLFLFFHTLLSTPLPPLLSFPLLPAISPFPSRPFPCLRLLLSSFHLCENVCSLLVSLPSLISSAPAFVSAPLLLFSQHRLLTFYLIIFSLAAYFFILYIFYDTGSQHGSRGGNGGAAGVCFCLCVTMCVFYLSFSHSL